MHREQRGPSTVPTDPEACTASGEPDDADDDLAVATGASVTRRRFLAGAAVAGGGIVAATVAACTTPTGAGWTFGPTPPPAGASSPSPASSSPASPSASPAASASAAASAAPSAGPSVALPAGWTLHDLNAQIKVRRFVGNLADPIGLGPSLDAPLGPITDDPEYKKVPQGNQPLAPRIDGDTKVFDLTVDEITWPIDALLPPLAALGFNKMWPGPLLRVTEGDKVRVNVTNNLKETTSVHFHGIDFADFRMDGVPFVSQLPIVPGATFAYEFVATPSGSQMYHSHHNATDQVGRGLLGAFIVEPKDPNERYDRKFGVTQEVIWIHNDVLGGFTINGHGFPATTPIVAKKGDRVLIRFMNEGTMTHPWHSHGFRQRVVARDGARLGGAEFLADTLGVNPGERWDTIIDCDRTGVFAFHCHILPHVEGPDGMFGMVTALVVLPA